MPEKIIKPDFKMDLSLFTRILPSFVVNEKVICLAGIESITYDWPEDDEMITGETVEPTAPLLTITYQSGNAIFLDQNEERELEQEIKAGIKKSEDQVTQLQALQQEVHMRGQRIEQLEQELARITLRQMQGGKIQMPGFKRN